MLFDSKARQAARKQAAEDHAEARESALKQLQRFTRDDAARAERDAAPRLDADPEDAGPA